MNKAKLGQGVGIDRIVILFCPKNSDWVLRDVLKGFYMSMSHSTAANTNALKISQGLTYDAEGVSLVSRFNDEISAHRAKKRWKNVLGNSFLLDEGRDFELWVSGSIEEDNFVLSCSFLSACGRYAFWRLINEQAPEAEMKLRGEKSSEKRSSSFFTENKDNKEPWILRLKDELEQVEQNQGLIKKILKLFK